MDVVQGLVGVERLRVTLDATALLAVEQCFASFGGRAQLAVDQIGTGNRLERFQIGGDGRRIPFDEEGVAGPGHHGQYLVPTGLHPPLQNPNDVLFAPGQPSPFRMARVRWRGLNFCRNGLLSSACFVEPLAPFFRAYEKPKD